MAKWESKRVQGMSYTEYGAQMFATGATVEQVADALYMKFDCPESGTRGRALAIQSKAQKAVAQQQAAPTLPRCWQDDPATQAQLRYLNRLHVNYPDGITKGRASDLIEFAKHGELGSTGEFYHDGSN